MNQNENFIAGFFNSKGRDGRLTFLLRTTITAILVILGIYLFSILFISNLLYSMIIVFILSIYLNSIVGIRRLRDVGMEKQSWFYVVTLMFSIGYPIFMFGILILPASLIFTLYVVSMIFNFILFIYFIIFLFVKGKPKGITKEVIKEYDDYS